MSASAVNYCARTGLLIDAQVAFLDDPHVFWTGASPLVPCGHVRCSRCKDVVRHVDGRRAVASASDENQEKLYQTPDPSTSPLLEGGVQHYMFRFYFCRCEWSAVSGTRILDSSDEPWGCDGHPDEDGTWKARIEGRAALFLTAREAKPEAVEAWEQLLAQEGRDGLPLYRELMTTTRNLIVCGRAAMAIGKFTGDYNAAKKVLSPTQNTSDEAANAENAKLLAEIPK